MRVIVFTKTSDVGPASRYRFGQYLDELRRAGIEVRTLPLFGPLYFRLGRMRPAALRILLKCPYVLLRFFARAVQLVSVRWTNLVVVENQLFPYLPAVAERWLARASRPWILEFDDAIYLTRLHRRKMEALCRLANRVIVGNRYLAGFARSHARAVSIVPTTIDLARFDRVRRRSRPPGTPLVIGWIGLPYNFDALKLLEAPLRQLLEESRLVLRIVSAGRPSLAGVPMEIRDWSLEREVDDIAGFDIGVMPLADDEWSRGKCGLKILQYFAAGIPVVASPVGVNADIIEDGQNGLLAADPAEWTRQLRRLAEDPTLRERLGRAGRETVEQSFSMNDWAPRIASIWRETAGGRPS